MRRQIKANTMKRDEDRRLASGSRRISIVILVFFFFRHATRRKFL